MGIAVWPAASSLHGKAIGRWRGKRGDRRGLSKEFILETAAENFRQDEQDEQNT